MCSSTHYLHIKLPILTPLAKFFGWCASRCNLPAWGVKDVKVPELCRSLTSAKSISLIGYGCVVAMTFGLASSAGWAQTGSSAPKPVPPQPGAEAAQAEGKPLQQAAETISPKSIIAKIVRLTATSGPEESGDGCNQIMDFYGSIRLAPANLIPEQKLYAIDFRREISVEFEKTEGQTISPDNWQADMPVGPADRYYVAILQIKDDDRSSPDGAKNCGGDDDIVSIQNVDPLSTQARLLIDAKATGPAPQVQIITGMERVGILATNRFSQYSLVPVSSGLGKPFILQGQKSAPHAADVELIITSR